MIIGIMRLEPCEGDYKKDGILHCGKCHAPKETVVRLWGGEPKIVPCLCKCGIAEREALRQKEQERKRKERIEQYRLYAFTGGRSRYEREENPADREELRMMRWNFDADDGANPDLRKKALNYVKNFEHFSSEGRGLLLFGGTGTGKTFLACSIVNAVVDAGKTAIVTNFAKIANDLLSTFDKQEYMRRLMSCDLLLLDDLDVERNTAYMWETIYNVIDGRYRAGKPMIVTTNLTAQQMKAPDSIEKKRVYSRLIDCCIPLTVTGKDRRYANAQRNRALDMEILNREV